MIKSTIKFDTEQLKKVRKNIDLRKTSVKNRLSNEMGKYLNKVKDEAQRIIKNEAYDTGALYNSIKIRWDGSYLQGEVYADGRVAKNQDGKSYTEWVELGHYLFPYGNKNARPIWIPGVYYMARATAKHRSYQNVVTAKLLQSFDHYFEGGEWFAQTPATMGLGGAALQKATGFNTSRGKARVSLRRLYTRTRRNRRIRLSRKR